MTSIIKYSAHMFLLVALLNVGVSSYAQNGNLYKEEEIKDRERDSLIQELEQQRKVDEQNIYNDLSEEELGKQNLVEVETNNLLPSDFANVAILVPYKVRRKKWGSLYSLTYMLYNPINFDTSFGGYFDEVFGDSIGVIELSYDYKYNFTLGALAAQGGVGFLSADAKDGTGSSITLTQYRLGLKYTLDNVFYEPIIAPYIGGGAYIMQYKETLSGSSANGNTDPAFYIMFGSYFQLDWMDRLASTEAYAEGGIENTYLFLEARNYMASSTANDPDFSTELSLSAGLALEF